MGRGGTVRRGAVAEEGRRPLDMASKSPNPIIGRSKRVREKRTPAAAGPCGHAVARKQEGASDHGELEREWETGPD